MRRARSASLADWRGKVVLLNLWATWCLPCRKEMPSLDRLQKEHGVGQVRGGGHQRRPQGRWRRPESFSRKPRSSASRSTPIQRARLSSDLRAIGLPATLLLDDQGREIGRLLGPAEWDSEDAKRLIRSVVR